MNNTFGLSVHNLQRCSLTWLVNATFFFVLNSIHAGTISEILKNDIFYLSKFHYKFDVYIHKPLKILFYSQISLLCYIKHPKIYLINSQYPILLAAIVIFFHLPAFACASRSLKPLLMGSKHANLHPIWIWGPCGATCCY